MNPSNDVSADTPSDPVDLSSGDRARRFALILAARRSITAENDVGELRPFDISLDSSMDTTISSCASNRSLSDMSDDQSSASWSTTSSCLDSSGADEAAKDVEMSPSEKK